MDGRSHLDSSSTPAKHRSALTIAAQRAVLLIETAFTANPYELVPPLACTPAKVRRSRGRCKIDVRMAQASVAVAVDVPASKTRAATETQKY